MVHSPPSLRFAVEFHPGFHYIEMFRLGFKGFCMPHIPLKYAPRLIWHGTRNFFAGKPVVISFETTLSCNANCRHCDLGLGIPNEKRMPPEDFREWVQRFHPPVIQLSGGEPFLRQDLLEIVKAVKINPFFPYTILVSNGWMLTAERYDALREAGVNQFSISLDFPDERHDDFRVIKGLFAKLDRVIPELAARGHGDVVLNTAITAENVRVLPEIIQTAKRWGVCLSFSVYTPHRTGDHSLSVTDPEDLRQVEELFELCKRRSGDYSAVVNSSFNLDGILKFMHDGHVPNCTAGKRFMVVHPSGVLNPCSLQRVDFATQEELVREFSEKNTCGGCYVSIRSYVEISFLKLLWENVSMRVFNRNHA
jgi:MoaA/NifB/PqqE/SkfB family radical SAM enzyme